jgi:hypothetical protein
MVGRGLCHKGKVGVCSLLLYKPMNQQPYGSGRNISFLGAA